MATDRCRKMLSADGRTRVRCGRITTVTDRFVAWNGECIEVHQCDAGHEQELATGEDG